MIPSPFEFVLLALGTFRLVRLVGWDSITAKLRARVTGYTDGASPTVGDEDADPWEEEEWRRFPARVYFSTLIRCPWCQGFYVSAGVWGLWAWLGDPVVVACVPLAVSSSVGLLAKNLDP